MAQQFKLVMAQLNLQVGDIDTNTDRIIGSAQQAVLEYGAAMIVFPAPASSASKKRTRGSLSRYS